MDIGVIGWWHYDNQGDLKILENITRALHPQRVVPIDAPFELTEDWLQRLNLLDFVILGGGGLFHDAPPIPFDTFDVWGNQLLTPVGVVGVGVDMVRPEYRRAVLALAEQACFFYVRDSVSQQLVGHPKVMEMPDVSFLYPVGRELEKGSLLRETAVCGVNLRRGSELHVDHWIETLRELPLQVRGIPFSTFGSWQELEILQQLDEGCATVFDPELYKDLDLMVGMAFHSVVFAIQAAIPTIAIAYAPKVRRFMTDIGLEDYVLEPDEWHKLPELIAHVLDDHDRVVDLLQEATARMTELAWQAMADIKQGIEQDAAPCPQSAPKVSIVIVGTESDAANQATIASCLAQTYGNVEIVFVGWDAGEYAGDAVSGHMVKIIPSDPSESLGASLNCAFDHTTGEYLSWTVAGNAYARDAIACMVHRLQSDPACDMVYTDYYAMHSMDLIAQVRPVAPAQKLFRSNVVGPCFLYRRSLGQSVGLFRVDTPLVSYDYWLRAQTGCRLQPMHTRLFYTLSTHEGRRDRQAERQTRRLWRSGEPWLLRAFWGIVDTDVVERFVIHPLLTGLRKVQAVFRSLSAQMR